MSIEKLRLIAKPFVEKLGIEKEVYEALKPLFKDGIKIEDISLIWDVLDNVRIYEDKVGLSKDETLTFLALCLSTIQRLAIDSTGRLKVMIDVALPAGTNIIGYIGAGGVFPIDQRYEMMQRANIEFNECQRSKFTFT